MSIRIDGIDEIEDILGSLAPRVARNVNRSAIHAVANEIRNEAKIKAPRQTGTLKKGIKSRRRRPRNPDKPYSDVYVTAGKNVRNDAFYWRFVEYGTQTQAPRPFFQPAIASVRPRVKGLYRRYFFEKLQARLAREAKKKVGK
jgi:HK97 gp10 family phage protein